jgi:arsenate reductase
MAHKAPTGSETVTIWHNPSCSKSRRTLEILREQSIEPVIVNYLEHPPSADEIERVLTALGKEPRDVKRRRDPLFDELGLGEESFGRRELIDVMVAHPILIERPIVIRGERAVVGRPPEQVLDLFR